MDTPAQPHLPAEGRRFVGRLAVRRKLLRQVGHVGQGWVIVSEPKMGASSLLRQLALDPPAVSFMASAGTSSAAAEPDWRNVPALVDLSRVQADFGPRDFWGAALGAFADNIERPRRRGRRRGGGATCGSS